MRTFLLLIVMLSFLPAFSQKIKMDYVPYDSTITIDKTNAKEITAFDSTPESIVTYFYASKIRNDTKWAEALPEQDKRTSQVNASIEEYKKWTFEKFKIVSKANYKEAIIFIKCYMEIVYNGGIDKGNFSIQLEKIDGKWTITWMPK